MSVTSLVYMRSITIAVITMALIGWVGQTHHEDSAITETLVLLANFSAALGAATLFFVVLKRRRFESFIQQDLRLFNINADRRFLARLIAGVLVVLLLFASWERIGYWRGVSWIYLSCLFTVMIFSAAFFYDYAIHQQLGDSDYRIFKRDHARIHIQLSHMLLSIAIVYAITKQSVIQTLFIIPILLAMVGVVGYNFEAWAFRSGKKEA